MRIQKLVEDENRFLETLTNVNNTKYSEEGTTVIGDSTIKHIRPKFDTYYYKDTPKKDLIVLHSTAGTLRGDLAELTKQNSYISVSYVIARNGIIYELFDPKYWSYHLGQGSVGGNKTNSQRSIGIELCNFGPLTNNDDISLETIYSKMEYTDKNGIKKHTKKDVYCTLDDIEYYTTVTNGYRGREYFASYTDDQYTSLRNLINYLCDKYEIPRNFILEDNRYDTFKTANDAKGFKGIASHVNFRKTGKWDIGPDFDWDKIITKHIIIDEPIEISISDLCSIPDTSKDINEKPDRVTSNTINKKTDNVSTSSVNYLNIFKVVLEFILKLLKK
jgi:N-acetylmuramoyl-L-alanine amidase